MRSKEGSPMLKPNPPAEEVKDIEAAVASSGPTGDGMEDSRPYEPTTAPLVKQEAVKVLH